MIKSMYIILVMTVSFAILGSAQWLRVGMPEIVVPLSVQAIALHGDTFFLGTYYGSIYRSVNAGVDWTALDSGLAGLFWTLSLLVEGDTVYAGAENGVYRTTDAGDSWTYSKQGLPDLSSILVMSLLRDGNDLLAATAGGIYRSSDDGLTWSFSSAGTSTEARALVSLDGALFVGTLVGIYKSTDGGHNWTAANNGLPPDLRRINVLSAGEGVVYAGTNVAGLWTSTNGGDLWVQDSGSAKFSSGFPYSIYSLARDGSALYVGTQFGGVFEKIPGDSTWHQISCGMPDGPYILSIAARDEIVYAAEYYSGLYRLADPDTCWTSVFSEYPGEVEARAIYAHRDRLFLHVASDYFNGTSSAMYRSSDKGNTWIRDPVLSEQHLFLIESYGDSLYAFGSGLSFSSDTGLNWTQIDSGLSYVDVLVKSDDTLVVAWGFVGPPHVGEMGSVFRSPDHGNTWNRVWTGDTAVFALAKAGNDLFFGGYRGVFRSTNSGVNWVLASNGLPSYPLVRQLRTMGTSLLVSTSYGVFRSTDTGDTWLPANNGLPADTVPLHSAFQLLVHDGLLLAGASPGVYLSTDTASSWLSVTNGLSGAASQIRSLAVAGDHLYVATYDGLWSRPLSEIMSADHRGQFVPVQSRLFQNFPNPFNPVTAFKYQLASNAHVVLSVHNILGQEVARLVDANKDAGYHSVYWEAASAASGLYFARMVVQGANGRILYKDTKKVLLMK